MQWFRGFSKPRLSYANHQSPFKTVSAKELLWPLVDDRGRLFPAVVAEGDAIEAGAVLAQDEDVKLIAPLDGTVSAVGEAPFPPRLRAAQAFKVTPGELPAPLKLGKLVLPDSATIRQRVTESALQAYLPGLVREELLPLKGDVQILVVNACDQDLGLISRAQLLQDSLEGLAAIMQLCRDLSGAQRMLLAVPKPAVSAVQEALGNADVEVLPVGLRYPEAHDRVLKSNLVRQGADSKGLRVIPFGLARALFILATTGAPPAFQHLTVVTRDGKSQNVRIPYGASLRAALDACGAQIDTHDRVLLGGPMAGTPTFSLDTPVLPGIEGVTVLAATSQDEVISRPCVNCGACIEVCPAKLQVQNMGRICEYGQYDDAPDLQYCIDCGLCAYVCPSARPLVQWFRLAKNARKLND